MMPDLKFILKSSPHFQHKDSVPKIMYAVILSLMPAVAASFYFFRLRALLLYVFSIGACLLTEALFLKLRKKPINAVWDGSAVITGLLLAMTLPPSLAPEMVVIGGVVAIALGKQVFGGLGDNIFNPALVGRAFLQVAFPVSLTTWIPPVTLQVNTATYATPLGNLKFYNALAEGTMTPLRDMFWGNTGGSLGETSAVALLLGAAFLLYKKAINWRIPVGILGTLTVFTGVFWLVNPERYASPSFHLLAGGLIIGAFFMATDMVTSPITVSGTWIFAVGIGLMVALIRLFGGYPEGVMFSILFMNTFVPLINRSTRPRIFGERRTS